MPEIPVDNSFDGLPGLSGCLLIRRQCVVESANQTTSIAIMPKRKKESKAQKRAKLRRANSAKRPKAGKARGKPTKRTAARAKPKRTPVKKAARKERMKQPAAPAVETVQHPAPEFEEVSQVSPGPDEPEE